ncbi:hypothetical protein GN156_33690 [bacterium LRH843]|nr:hypothetical protein [bacterium LRH843]
MSLGCDCRVETAAWATKTWLAAKPAARKSLFIMVTTVWLVPRVGGCHSTKHRRRGIRNYVSSERANGVYVDPL